jgi:hypothetical protein
MRRNLLLIAGDLFPSVRELVRRDGAADWDELVLAYARSHPARDWDPNGFGALFSEYLQHQSELPAYLAELADYHYTMFSVGVALRRASGTSELENTVCVRQYEYDVLEFMRRWREDETSSPPDERACAVVIYQRATSGEPAAFQPTRLEILVLLESCGREVDFAAMSATPQQLRDARQRLRERGVQP